MGRQRHTFTCAITREKIDIRRFDTVMIAGRCQDGKRFKTYARMKPFFRCFVNRKDIPKPLPGLRPYRNIKHPKVRFIFDPARFGEHIQSWAQCKILIDLLR